MSEQLLAQAAEVVDPLIVTGQLLVDGPVPFWVHIFRVLLSVAFFLLGTALLIWAERRLVAKMQSRVGPNRAGPFGLLQSALDGAKLFFKEDIVPGMANKPIYKLAPLVSVACALTAFAVVPLGGTVTIFGETFALQAADISVGLLWFLAVGSIAVYGIALGGWASNSIYPLLGGVRSTAQMISYEIAQGLAVASVFIWAGTLRVSEIVNIQASEASIVYGLPNWFVFPLAPAFLIFAIGMTAETQRPPFDLPESEAELVGGFNTEYSGVRFAMFFLAEFMNVITVSAIAVTTFFGGPAGPTVGPEWAAGFIGLFWFALKTFGFVFVFILLRGALPRFRYDRLMDLGWKVLIPLGLVWAMVTGAAVVTINQLGDNGRFAEIAFVGIALIVAAVMLWLPGARIRRVGPSQQRRAEMARSAPTVAPLEAKAGATIDDESRAGV